MEAQSRRCSRDRESSPDRAKLCMQVQGQAHPPRKPIKKLKVVYYISRNGQLEHPHYMELTHLPNQHPRLRDFMDRLTLLRGKGMPSMYSWSCKRSYKNGYVWNDLAEDDVIYPSEGAEFVLKGSEIVEGCSEKFQQQLHVSNGGIANRQPIHHQDPILHAKRPQQLAPRQPGQVVEEARSTSKYEYQEYDDDPEDESPEEFEDEDMKTSYTSSTTPHSRCSRGVSTDELEPTNESTRHDSVPPQSLMATPNSITTPTGVSKRFEDGDPAGTGSASSRNSVLLQLISCGNLATSKAKDSTGAMKQKEIMAKMNVCSNNKVVKRSESDLHRGVLFKSAVKVAEEELMISCMSEDPRFGNLQAEEKEYFSGSIVESMSEERVVTQNGLKRSNSYGEERNCKPMVEEVKEEMAKEKTMRAKCIPLKKYSTSSKPTKK